MNKKDGLSAYSEIHSGKKRLPISVRIVILLFAILATIGAILFAFDLAHRVIFVWLAFCLIICACIALILFQLSRLQRAAKGMQLLADHARRLQEFQDVPASNGNDFELVDSVLNQYGNYLQKDMAEQLLIRGLELDAWQHQINPHFLYNTLETIRSQAIEDHSLQSAEMIELLGQILRYSLNRHSNLCTVDQELKCVESYFRIQQYRFANRFQLMVSIDENDFVLHRYKLPRLTLQPLIENAIYHGLDSKLGIGKIRLEFQHTTERILISVIDDGIGMPPERLRDINSVLQSFNYKQRLSAGKNQKFGLALQNINARIKLLYGYEYGITVFSDAEIGTQVMINLPVEVPHEE